MAQFGYKRLRGYWRRHFTREYILVANLAPIELEVFAPVSADDRSIQRNPRKYSSRP